MTRAITLRDIYDVVNRLEDKLDKRVTDLEKRVDTLESFKGWTLGLFTVIGTFTGGFAAWVWNKITK